MDPAHEQPTPGKRDSSDETPAAKATLDDSWFRWERPTVPTRPIAGIGDDLADAWFKE